MMTKTAFFALLKDKENRLNPTAHIAFFEEANGYKSVIVRQQSAPNFGLSMHRLDAAAQAAFTKYNAWLNEWLVAQTAAAQARIDLLDQIEADHAEALAINDAYDRQIRFYCCTARYQQVQVGWAHEGAIVMNAELDDANLKTFLGENALSTTENVIPMNKAKAKQQQTPDNLPRLQLVDVVRAAMRKMSASQGQIDAVSNLTDKELRGLIITLTRKGARVTAHLTKSKSAGYGFLTFGCDGQLPAGTYHKMVVTGMKNAREVATQYGAMMWNF